MKHKPSIDNRPDWRDPNMPVLVRVRQPNGVSLLKYVPPEAVTKYYIDKMINMEIDPLVSPPAYYEDESYYWNRKKS